ncbi:hypothetical protein [Nonomuraea aridisoli]|nr:hypothetical protein [Nonomuraea aridisoli]
MINVTRYIAPPVAGSGAAACAGTGSASIARPVPTAAKRVIHLMNEPDL